MPLPIWPAPMTPMRLITMDTSEPLLLLYGGSELGNNLEEITHDAVVGDLEDRRLFVFINSHDGLAVLHPGEMLDRAGDADGDVEIGSDHLAGLADLVIVRHVARIDRRAAGAEARTQRVGKLLEDLEVLAAAETAAAGHDDLGAGQLGPLALGELGTDIRRKTLGALAADLLDRSRPTAGHRLEVGRADGDDLDLVGGLHGGHRVAGIDRTHER